MGDCANPTSETKVNQCKWLAERRKFNNVLTEMQTVF